MAKMTKIKMICPDCGKVDEIEEEQTISYLTGRTPEVEGEHRKTLMGRFLDIDSKIYHNRRIEARVCDIISVKDDEPCYSCFLMNESSFRHMMENVSEGKFDEIMGEEVFLGRHRVIMTEWRD